jgi:cytochrome c oxidase subunit I
MATTAAAPPYTESGTYAGQRGIWSWLTTVDHKRIGTLYLWTALIFFMIGGLEAVLIRIQLQSPNLSLMSAEFYNQLFTMHGTTMVFLAIMPLSAAFFNYLIPLQIGARDVAFPRLNAFSYWVYLFGGIFITLPILWSLAPDGGWFGYTPLTTRTYSPGRNIDFWVIGLQILGVSSLAAAFNFATTIINMRAPGMTLMRMPMFTWMSFVVQFLIILAFPVITIALVFLLFDRFFGSNFYSIAAGGDPLLWQHLFWIFGHPEVYILILPAFGLVSEVLPTHSRKPLFGYAVMVYSGILIGFLGFGVWAHHMFAVGMGPIADTVFGVTTMLIAIPTGVKIFNWIATMALGQIRFTTAMLFGIGLISLFTIGGISGIMHASPPANLQQTDTYFVVAHFHYVLFGGSIFGIFAGIYHYFPKMTGRFMSERWGKIHFWLSFAAMNLTFFPMHYAGMLGMPRRIYTYGADQGWDTFNLMSSVGSYLLAISVAVFVVNFVRSWFRGATAGPNPWNAPTLEWSLPSPPPEYNFAQIPNVHSRYPLWDKRAGDEDHPAVNLIEGRSPEEMGVVMPYNTIKPLIVAAGLVTMFLGLMFWHPAIFIGALVMIVMLYWWLLSPIEPHHETHHGDAAAHHPPHHQATH